MSDLAARVRAFLRSNVLIYLIGSVVSRIGAIILIPLYTRRLSPADYGEYSLALTGLQLLPTCASLGLLAAVSRAFFAKDDDAERRRDVNAIIRGILLVMVATLVPLALGIALLAPPVLFGLRRYYWLLVIVAAAGTGVFSIPELLFRLEQKPKKVVTIQLASFLLNASLGIFFVLVLRRGLSGAIEALATGGAITCVLGVGYILWKLPAPDVIARTHAALRISLPLVPHHLASWLQLTADRWVLSTFASTAALGTYYLALQMASPIPMVSGAWNDSEMPRLGEIYRQEGAQKTFAVLPRWFGRYAFVTFLPALAIVLGSPLLPLFVGSRFTSAITILPLICIAYVVDSLYFPSSNYLVYVGRTTLIPIATVMSALFGLGLSIVLLRHFGPIGIVISRIGASIFRSGAMATAAAVARRGDARASTPA